MVMKKIIYALTLAALFTAVSCADYLEQTPTNQYTDAQVWQDEFLVESHLAELYAQSVFMINDAVASFNNSPLNVDFSMGASWNLNLGVSAQGEGPVHTTTIADEAKYSERGAQTNYHGMKMYGLQSNGSTLRWWSNGYYLNRQLNHMIESMESSTFGKAKAFQAEARFLRAFNYFAMVKRYGGVPLIKKETPIDASDAEIYPPRDKEKDCWDFIINECLEVADLLEANPKSGRASKWAALALASRAALYAGSIAQYGTVQLDGILGIDAQEAKGYYETAAKACEQIMTGSGKALYKGSMGKGYVQNLKDIFLVKDNSEAILVKHHQGAAGENSADLWSWDICMCPKPNAWSVGQYSHPYYDFVEQFDYKDGKPGVIAEGTLTSKAWTMDELFGNRDPRLEAWVWTNRYPWPGAVGSPWGNDTVSMYRGIRLPDGSDVYATPGASEVYTDAASGLKVSYFGDQMREFANAPHLAHTGFGVSKYLDPTADNSNWFVCSTTDYIIFRYAEVLLNYAEACFELGRTGDALNAINQIRSRAGVAELPRVTRESIRKERLCELCFENHRYWDLRRWREAETVLSQPHRGITYLLDLASYAASINSDGKRTSEPRFWIEIDHQVDSKTKDPIFPASNYYFPIGDGTTTVNPNLRENPGY